MILSKMGTVSEKIIGFRESKVKESDFSLYSFKDILWIVVCNALYKREIVMDVRFPAGIIFEDNYASGMYIIKSRTVVELKDTLYYYRRTLSGVSKGLKNHPFDVLIIVSRLRNDLFKLGFTDKRMDSLVAAETFRLIRDRGASRMYRIKAIDKEWYEYVKDNLSLRRKLILYYLLHKMHIDVI